MLTASKREIGSIVTHASRMFGEIGKRHRNKWAIDGVRENGLGDNVGDRAIEAWEHNGPLDNWGKS